MAYLAVNKDGCEYVYSEKPSRDIENKCWKSNGNCYHLLSISEYAQLYDKQLTWNDEPIEVEWKFKPLNLGLYI